MLFSTNIFIWTAVSCNCSEGTTATECNAQLGYQKLLHFYIGLFVLNVGNPKALLLSVLPGKSSKPNVGKDYAVTSSHS